MKNFFSNGSDGRMKARSLFIDLEPSAIDEIRSSPYKDLFDENSFISGKDDSGHLFSQGIMAGRQLINEYMDQIRWLAEECEAL